MKTFQLAVRIHQNEVMQRLASIVQLPRVFGPSAGFVGRLNAYDFCFRRVQRFSRNSLAPVCMGSVAMNPQGGSVMNYRIGANRTVFFILAGVFIVIFGGAGLLFGLMSAAIAFSSDELSLGAKVLSLTPFLLPVGVFFIFALIFYLGKWMGKSDETAMETGVRQLFADVTTGYREG
jgi:hypothetical protein